MIRLIVISTFLVWCGVSLADEGAKQAPAAGGSVQRFVINKPFGPTVCAVGDKLKKETGKLQKECSKWDKSQSKKLGKRYLTGTCNDSCSECPGNSVLKQCKVQGVVHYFL